MMEGRTSGSKENIRILLQEPPGQGVEARRGLKRLCKGEEDGIRRPWMGGVEEDARGFSWGIWEGTTVNRGRKLKEIS